MNKLVKKYISIWVILLVLFNIITFLFTSVPLSLPLFWMGYGVITLSFVGQMGCAYFALKESNMNKMFYNITLITTSYFGLIFSFVIGVSCMLVSFIPVWLGSILCLIVLALNGIAIIKSKMAIDVVDDLDEKIKEQTFFMKSLAVDAKVLIEQAQDEDMKKECKKVYEMIYYADPKSTSAIKPIEDEIASVFNQFSNAVLDKNIEDAKLNVNKIGILIETRNEKCKLLK